MRHLSTEELLLLADGELTASQVEHFDGCVECQERLGALQGELTAVSSALSATLPSEDNSAQSWTRLESALTQAAAVHDLHLSPEELLLLIDGGLSPVRAGHAGRCAGCGSAHSDVRRLLWDVEGELRALVPSEPLERRLAAEQALKQHLYPTERKVIVFPAPRMARYAAAAALLVSAFAGYQIWNQTPQVEQAVITAQAALPQADVPRAAVRSEIEPQTLIAQMAEPTIVASPVERFEAITVVPAVEPLDQPIDADAPTVRLARFETAALGFEFGRLPTVAAPTPAAPVRQVAAAEVVSGALGGLVRTALVEHYRDAARRSFQTADAPALDAEIARYVSDVFRSQSDLIGHVYELDQLLSAAPAGGLPVKQVRLHLNGALNSEAVIYDHLSEALPRRYWRYQGEEGADVASNDLRAESKALLQDVLGLERTLTTVLTGSRQTVGMEEANSSSGELLRRIHERLSHIKDLTRSAF
ncbi:MAG: hypothetical protein O3A53_19650 [Acidobacteria bacterium]|nr:hypothetical protein [Acidobacteriota bacterium]MDA1236998.1 hypothetical protein [Acidobacteriota bacterium]